MTGSGKWLDYLRPSRRGNAGVLVLVPWPWQTTAGRLCSHVRDDDWFCRTMTMTSEARPRLRLQGRDKLAQTIPYLRVLT
jgi:hypothetical protein